jgi:hypothetical protein
LADMSLQSVQQRRHRPAVRISFAIQFY